VVDARFAVRRTDAAAAQEELRGIVRWRSEHQPGGANAGSVFRNPPGDAAARLIDAECGLRGLRVGGAAVSEKHANFIQAEAGATASDVHHLIALVRDRVEMATGVRLETEVHQIGFGTG
jgi:UDP-N-acetylmuramate dehydrogenase